MPACLICLKIRSRQNMKFSTRRMKVCRWCVGTLNRETLTLQQASEQRAAALHSYLFHKNANLAASRDPPERERGEWGLRTLDAFIEQVAAGGFAQQVADVGDQSVEIKIIRAVKKGLILPARQYTAYPANWGFTSLYIKHLDGEKCNLCKRSRLDDPDLILHAHHIVHRSNGGTNNRKNLVALCYSCHQKQHPDIVISLGAGEPDGVYDAPSDIQEQHGAQYQTVAAAVPPPQVTNYSAYPIAKGRSFDRNLALQVAGRGEEIDTALGHMDSHPQDSPPPTYPSTRISFPSLTIADNLSFDRNLASEIVGRATEVEKKISPSPSLPVRSQGLAAPPSDAASGSEPETSGSSDATVPWVVFVVLVIIVLALL